MAAIPLPIGSYEYDDPAASSFKLLNCTTEAIPGSGEGPLAVKRLPGIDTWTSAGTKLRGMHVMDGVLFVVSDTMLYKVSSDGTATSLGTISGSNQVSMADNGSTLVIVATGAAYTSNGSTVSRIVDSTFVNWGANSVDYIDGYFVFTQPGTERFFNTDLNAITFDALNFASADGGTDDLLGVIVDNRELFLAGETTCELWFNAGNATGSPFSRSPNGFIQIGCASFATVAAIDNTIFWLANDRTVRRLIGTNPTIISTPGIAKFFDSEDLSAAHGLAYTYRDRHYYAVTVSGVTLEYDLLSQQWHHRESYTKNNWLPLQAVEAYDSVIIGDAKSGNIGKLNQSTYTEWGSAQLVEWTYAPVYAEGRRVFHDRLEIGIAGGVGATGEGAPELMLFISDDGGNSFTEHGTAEFGATGDRQARAVFRNLGSSYNRVYRCRVSDPVAVHVTDTQLERRVGLF